jgi:nucleoside-diphosphate-sugar epimerase
VRYRQVDLADVGQVVGALAGCSAVVHLGAIPAPNRHADEVVFANNTRATFGVLQAASLLGIRRAVIASSVSAIGHAYPVNAFAFVYAPVDEEHPLLGQDPYALSKEVDESTAAMFNRRSGLSVLAYRFHWVAAPGEAAAQAGRARDDPARGRHQLWGYVDVRDAAQACRLGVEVDGLGFEVFNIIAADTLADTPTEELIRRYWPEIEMMKPLHGTETAWSIDKARRLLGYEPRHSWRDP